MLNQNYIQPNNRNQLNKTKLTTCQTQNQHDN